MGENSGENSTSVVRALGSASDGDGSVEELDHIDDQEVLMKRMISGHPLFELLIETHINCLKVGLGEIDELVTETSLLDEDNNSKFINAGSTIPTSTELDKFMDAYCMALNKLREAMEEPLRDATSFITNMYAQLSDLRVSENAELEDVQTLVFSDKDYEDVQNSVARKLSATKL
ncbi:Homeobox protein knotted-1-like 1 [Morus notabilis]|uniref:Homeobox protein knotted-1-like 1 n=1 Tax=Morus notabilis TaxID=981085 RepID=W9QT75_9ROSA|nr:homeobox protein knotted-1-like 1 [Morus notabilis]EXB53852.1 Homeobox protein knotted-1-like 1 [Morus notabilis]